eukprot:353142-Prymnesium_polylepis.1
MRSCGSCGSCTDPLKDPVQGRGAGVPRRARRTDDTEPSCHRRLATTTHNGTPEDRCMSRTLSLSPWNIEHVHT